MYLSKYVCQKSRKKPADLKSAMLEDQLKHSKKIFPGRSFLWVSSFLVVDKGNHAYIMRLSFVNNEGSYFLTKFTHILMLPFKASTLAGCYLQNILELPLEPVYRS